ncbi:pyridoxine/pyridoxamine 5'-phosphate oxidase-like [Ischnura elegans]|uniref:pyridoxine/pyridoxamine 5'-phosphate oxidase-like n=1 Tax=Ischnura elegans TaxID=197161 RepID=UPI001ED8BDC0|nr:pyridoxine/pyridoxamine 5'-phosphate oxidase-like [Ischnura elegans]
MQVACDIMGAACTAPFPTSATENESSNLCKITLPSSDPMDLFKEWYEAAKEAKIPHHSSVCVASSSSSGYVTSRSLVVRQLDDDGFIVMTDRRSLKVKQWEENPRAAFHFFWGYTQGDRILARQVRVEGRMEELSNLAYAHLYEREPLYCKIRSHICNQGQRVEWDELKASHDDLLNDVKAGLRSLPMPEHIIVYKLHPNMMEFFDADDISIGDRVVFSRDDAMGEWKGSWKHHHIAA